MRFPITRRHAEIFSSISWVFRVFYWPKADDNSLSKILGRLCSDKTYLPVFAKNVEFKKKRTSECRREMFPLMPLEYSLSIHFLSSLTVEAIEIFTNAFPLIMAKKLHFSKEHEGSFFLHQCSNKSNIPTRLEFYIALFSILCDYSDSAEQLYELDDIFVIRFGKIGTLNWLATIHFSKKKHNLSNEHIYHSNQSLAVAEIHFPALRKADPLFYRKIWRQKFIHFHHIKNDGNESEMCWMNKHKYRLAIPSSVVIASCWTE